MARRTLALVSLILSLFLWLQACGRRPTPQASCNFVQDSEQQRLSWKSQHPIDLYVHESVPPEAYGAIQAAMDIYQKALGYAPFKVVAWGINSNPVPEKDGTSVIYWMNTWEADRPEEQARTTIYWMGPVIQEADIRINAANFQYSYSGAPSSDKLDLESIMVHELGHVLGLAHVTNAPSVMAPSLANGVERRTLAKLDLTDLKCEY